MPDSHRLSGNFHEQVKPLLSDSQPKNRESLKPPTVLRSRLATFGEAVTNVLSWLGLVRKPEIPHVPIQGQEKPQTTTSNAIRKAAEGLVKPSIFNRIIGMVFGGKTSSIQDMESRRAKAEKVLKDQQKIASTARKILVKDIQVRQAIKDLRTNLYEKKEISTKKKLTGEFIDYLNATEVEMIIKESQIPLVEEPQKAKISITAWTKNVEPIELDHQERTRLNLMMEAIRGRRLIGFLDEFQKGSKEGEDEGANSIRALSEKLVKAYPPKVIDQEYMTETFVTFRNTLAKRQAELTRALKTEVRNYGGITKDIAIKPTALSEEEKGVLQRQFDEITHAIDDANTLGLDDQPPFLRQDLAFRVRTALALKREYDKIEARLLPPPDVVNLVKDFIPANLWEIIDAQLEEKLREQGIGKEHVKVLGELKRLLKDKANDLSRQPEPNWQDVKTLQSCADRCEREEKDYEKREQYFELIDSPNGAFPQHFARATQAARTFAQRSTSIPVRTFWSSLADALEGTPSLEGVEKAFDRLMADKAETANSFSPSAYSEALPEEVFGPTSADLSSKESLSKIGAMMDDLSMKCHSRKEYLARLDPVCKRLLDKHPKFEQLKTKQPLQVVRELSRWTRKAGVAPEQAAVYKHLINHVDREGELRLKLILKKELGIHDKLYQVSELIVNLRKAPFQLEVAGISKLIATFKAASSEKLKTLTPPSPSTSLGAISLDHEMTKNSLDKKSDKLRAIVHDIVYQYAPNFAAITRKELSDKPRFEGKKEKVPQITLASIANCVEGSTALAQVVKGQITLAKSAEERKVIINNWSMVLAELTQQGAYAPAQSILSGILFGGPLGQEISDLVGGIKSLQKAQKLFSDNKNYKNLRKTEADRKNIILPSLALMGRDLIYLNEGLNAAETDQSKKKSLQNLESYLDDAEVLVTSLQILYGDRSPVYYTDLTDAYKRTENISPSMYYFQAKENAPPKKPVNSKS